MEEVLFRWLLTAKENVSTQAESPNGIKSVPIVTDSKAVNKKTHYIMLSSKMFDYEKEL